MNTISPISFGNRGLVEEGTHSCKRHLGKTLEQIAEGTEYAKGRFAGDLKAGSKTVQPRFDAADSLGSKFEQANSENIDPESVYHPTVDYVI